MASANLQLGLTVAQAAKLMNVSERSVYMAKELLATGRDDLSAAVLSGTMSLLAALRIAKPEKYGPKRKDGLAVLRRAWATASENERDAFLADLGL